MKQTARLYVAVQFLLFGVLVAAFALVPLEQPWLLRPFGFFWMLVGVVTVVIAIQEHRKTNPGMIHVTPEPNNRVPLVQSGLYRTIRHPIYTGVLIAALGVGIAHGSLLVLAISLVFIPFFTFKSRFEEQLLKTAYPEYPDYMQRTGRFVPPLKL
ncbi:MAG: hypothetical protein OHK0046_26170 [Anaerolineae bacterium]